MNEKDTRKPPIFDVMLWSRATIIGANEGLLVLLVDLIRGLDQIGVRTRLHATSRNIPALIAALEINGLRQTSYDLSAYKVTPGILRLLPQPRTKRRPRMLMRLARVAQHAEAAFVYTSSRASLSLIVLLCVVALAVVSTLAVLIPHLILGAVVAGLFGLFAAGVVIINLIISTNRATPKILLRLRGGISSIIGRMAGNRLPKRSSVTKQIMDESFDVECDRLAEAIGRRNDVTTVFVPFSTYGNAIRKLRKPAMVVFPDTTPLAYSTRFYGHFSQADIDKQAASVQSAQTLVCYSQEIVDAQLRKFFAKEVGTKKIHVIPQGFFPIKSAVARDFKPIKYVNHFPHWCSYIPAYSLDEIQYVVYPSVDRPHKNSLTLLRAVELLVRKRHINLKFITTSHHVGPEAGEFIIRRRMFLDALYTTRLNEAELEALIGGAQVMVHPSLAEGGDIFNFSRAVSVGVPALMADIPVVREMFDRWDIAEATYRPWLFDATNAPMLADHIARTIANRAEVVSRQRKAYQKLMRYDYTAMASRYYEVYRATGAPAALSKPQMLPSAARSDDPQSVAIHEHAP